MKKIVFGLLFLSSVPAFSGESSISTDLTGPLDVSSISPVLDIATTTEQAIVDAVWSHLKRKKGIKLPEVLVPVYVEVRENGVLQKGCSGRTLEEAFDCLGTPSIIIKDAEVGVSLFFHPQAGLPQPWMFPGGPASIAAKRKSEVHLIPASMFISRNWRWKQAFDMISLGRTPEKEWKFWALNTLHLRSKAPGQVRVLSQGDPLITPEEVTIDRLIKFLDDAAEWLLMTVRTDGEIKHEYFSTAHTLEDLYQQTDDRRFLKAHEKNLQYNIRTFLRTFPEDSTPLLSLSEADQDAVERVGDRIKKPFSYVVSEGKSTLGAAACAFIALYQSPSDYRKLSFTDNLLTLISEVLYNPRDGSFTTHLLPEGRNDNQSTDPGQALLALAIRFEETHETHIKDLIARSRTFYLPAWRNDKRNAAYTPWHTMAYYRMFKATGEPEYQAAVFEMNDWLTDTVDFDTLPSASTALYVQSLAYAYRLATEVADLARTNAYKIAVRRGTRTLLQLQYRPDNVWYVAKPSRVLGGLRTTTYDNSLRLENTTNAIDAALLVVRFVDWQ